MQQRSARPTYRVIAGSGPPERGHDGQTRSARPRGRTARGKPRSVATSGARGAGADELLRRVHSAGAGRGHDTPPVGKP
ncbi:hypothetical protein K3495_g3521 [Podosphaera aphanis]|nr:hypothetical protein K3495_g3521 [Podosphaera aphanis]